MTMVFHTYHQGQLHRPGPALQRGHQSLACITFNILFPDIDLCQKQSSLILVVILRTEEAMSGGNPPPPVEYVILVRIIILLPGWLHFHAVVRVL
jgi:hypothetical protein